MLCFQKVKSVNASVCILIPAYNPNSELIKLVNDLYQLSKEAECHTKLNILIVNDGSNNHESKMIFEQLEVLDNMRVIHLDKNMGKGSALKEGMRFIKKAPVKYFVTADADGQHEPIDMLRVLNKSILDDDFVIGTRNITQRKTPIKSLVGNKLTSVVFQLITRKKLQDTQSGLRAFPVRMIDELLNIDGDRYEYELSVLLHFYKGKENTIDIKKIYIDNNKLTSFRPVVDSFLVYRAVLKYVVKKGTLLFRR